MEQTQVLINEMEYGIDFIDPDTDELLLEHPVESPSIRETLLDLWDADIHHELFTQFDGRLVIARGWSRRKLDSFEVALLNLVERERETKPRSPITGQFKRTQ